MFVSSQEMYLLLNCFLLQIIPEMVYFLVGGGGGTPI